MRKVTLKLLVLSLFLATLLHAQAGKTYTYSGFVYDKSNGEGLIGANVFLKEKNYGASTNISGYFVIANIPAGEYTLICSYIGYKTETKIITVTNNCDDCVTFNLAPESLETEEIVVSADSIRTIDKLYYKPVSKIDLTPAQINNIPRVVEADLLRALQTLPGITALSDFSSALYIRGGTPDQNLYLIDGTDVYNPEHAFGIFSTFNTAAIKRAEVSKGGFGAEYGGRLSSVLDVNNVDGNRKNFEGEFNLSLLSASTTLQMPVGSKGSVSASYRRTYIDQTLSKAIDGIPDYYFYDANIKGFYEFDQKNKLSVSFFRSYDDLDYKWDKEAQESFRFIYDWGNMTGSVNWKHIFSQKLFASFWLTGSRFESNFNFNAVNLTEYNYLSDYALKGALEYYHSKEFNMKFGAEQKLLHETYDQETDDQRIYINSNRQYSSGYVTGNWKPNDDWSFDIGVRANYFNTDTSFFNIEPRFTAKYRLSETMNIKFATGRYHQYINRIPRLFFSSIWATANKYNNESSSMHYILGFQKEVADIYEFEIEGYYKTYKNLYQFNPHVGASIKPGYHDENDRPVYTTLESVFNQGDGESYGMEILFKKDVGALTGWVSYTLSRTKYTFDAINQGEKFTPRHDRTSVVNFVLNADLDNLWNDFTNKPIEHDDSRWLLGMTFVYASGQPITVPASGYYMNPMPDWNNYQRSGELNPAYNLYPAEINTFRIPDYIRMDVSLTWELEYDGWKMSPYLQIFNVGYRKNVWFIQYDQELEDGSIIQKVDKVTMLPILPSLGVKINF